ncbi:probable G-protein coupled receptor 148 [Stegostoma tigrinum]|uniref:probable G-protein coupled receptor 148 n=1 Tax=Stegostoma tigrinum TaxID=3053191 RepID=UPI00202B1894|nr:probable G-protein coupled receptor 148 [Stegostoma tigrinum]
MNLSKCEYCNSNKMPVQGEEIVAVQFSANASHPDDLRLQYNVIQAWMNAMVHSKTDILMIPLVVCLFASLLATPLVLLAIFSNSSLRQETRYLLLANTLANDLIYSILNTSIDALNAAGVGMPKVVCETLLYVLTVAYCNGILTVTAMVVDTYVAVGWPLRYTSLLPRTRTLKIIVCIWIISALAPSIVYIITLGTQQDPFSTLSICILPLIFVLSILRSSLSKIYYSFTVIYFLICLILIFSCYVMLYRKTRSSGIWAGNSRARQTYVINSVLFIFYFFPLIVLVTGSALQELHLISYMTGLWITLSMANMLMMLPKAISPYVYAFRYREVTETIWSLSMLRHVRRVSPTG